MNVAKRGKEPRICQPDTLPCGCKVKESRKGISRSHPKIITIDNMKVCSHAKKWELRWVEVTR